MPSHISAELITKESRLNQIVGGLLKEKLVAVDTESNGFFRYPERVCLVQLSSKSGCYLVDPLAVNAAEPLSRIFRNSKVKKVLHSAENDIRVLDREWGINIINLYDTSIGAKFLGADRLGLSNIMDQFLQLKIEKDKKVQRSDWGIRPLSEKALDYAALDVLHLVRLMDALIQKTDTLNRSSWVTEECQRIENVRYVKPDPPELSFLSAKGSSILDGRGLAVLRELVIYRETVARRMNRPPFRIISDRALVTMSGKPDCDLAEVPDVGPNVIRRFSRGLNKAIEKGLGMAPVDRRSFKKRVIRKPTSDQTKNLKALRQWRNTQGSILSLEPSVIWPTDSLIRLARQPASLEDELRSPEVRSWQVAEFKQSLVLTLSELNVTP